MPGSARPFAAGFHESLSSSIQRPAALRANDGATLATRTLASCEKNQCMKKSGRKCRGAWTRRRKGRGCGGANAQKIPRRTGYAKRHAGSLFNFILSWGTCTRTWAARKRSRRWRSGGRQKGRKANESLKVPAWPPHSYRRDMLRKLVVPWCVQWSCKARYCLIKD